MKIRLLFLFIIILSLRVEIVPAQTLNDEQIVFRSFDQKKIDQYKENSNYYYLEAAPSNNWERFIQWLSKKFEKIFKNVPERKLSSVIMIVFKILLWGLGIFAITMVFITLFKGKVYVVQKADKGIEIDYQHLEEKIDVDWQSLIDVEMAAGRFNLALRLLFLQTIQLLNEKNLICWEKDKTNFDYLRELRKTGKGESFSHLIKFYNFGWFGGFKVEEKEFIEIHNEFKAFNTSVL